MDPKNNKILSVGNWTRPTKHYKNWNNHTKIEKMRNVSLSFYADRLYPNVKENQTALVAKNTDTELKIFVVIKNFDLMYSEHYRVNLLFEVKTPTAHSHQVAIRISSQI